MANGWWNLDGAITSCVAAYQPIGAASYAASKVNLANPGTYDAVDGAAYPTWAAETGWAFAGASSQHLRTTLTMGMGATNQSSIVRFSGGNMGNVYLYGVAITYQSYGLSPNFWGGVVITKIFGQTTLAYGTGKTAGVMCISGDDFYYNGSHIADISVGSTQTSGAIYIGCVNNAAGTGEAFWTGTIEAIAFYNTALSAEQVSALTSAMAALPVSSIALTAADLTLNAVTFDTPALTNVINSVDLTAADFTLAAVTFDASTLTNIVVTPACRTYTIAAESRALTISAESRTLAIEAESRGLAISCDSAVKYAVTNSYAPLVGKGLTLEPLTFESPTLGGYRDLWLHTIYVATTGDDATGDGSQSTPYKTLTKAMTVAVAGDGILLADGTYAEDTSSNGALMISKNLADWLYIEPEAGSAGSVTITGTTGYGGYNIVFSPGSTSQYLKFRYLNFGMSAGTTGIFRSMATMRYINFEHCTFTPISTCIEVMRLNAAHDVQIKNSTILEGGAISCKGITAPLNSNITNLLVDSCTINGGSGSTGTAIFLNTNSALGGSMLVNNCTLNAYMPINQNIGGTLTVTNSTLNAGFEVLIGVDGNSELIGGNCNTTALFKDCTINKNVDQMGHALIFGTGCVDCVADNVTIPKAYDYGIVVKENTGTEIKNCHVASGGTSALLYKAAVSPNAHDNVFYGENGSSNAFQIRNGDNPAHIGGNWRFTNNIVYVTTYKALGIGNDDHDTGGGVCDYNTYQNNSGLGRVRNDADVQSLAELQAAWADYDVTTNDAHSTVI